jgi:hypothetical protein
METLLFITLTFFLAVLAIPVAVGLWAYFPRKGGG